MIRRKIISARTRLDQKLAEMRHSSAARRRARVFSSWVSALKSRPPDALVGGNLAEFGGVRNHVHAIAKYSSLRVELAPGDDLLESVGAHEITTRFKNEFDGFRPGGIKAIHSHVFPWFIEWCRLHREHAGLWVHTYHLPYFPEHAKGELAAWQVGINKSLTGEARHADVRISVARWQQTYLLESQAITTVYLPNGVDVALCDEGDAERFRSWFGTDEFVLYVGRNDPVKNPADFVRLAVEMPDVRFVMFGRDLTRESISTDWQIEPPPNLDVLGEGSHAQVQDALAATAAVVVTSWREGLPTLVLEAMTHRLPIVVPNEQGCVEATSGNRFGFVYEPGSIDDLVAMTRLALDDRSKGEQSRSAGSRAHVLEHFDWRAVAPRLDDIYRGVNG